MATNDGSAYRRDHWEIYVLLSVGPLALFLLFVWVFLGGDAPFVGVLADFDGLASAIAFARNRIGIVILNYSTYCYVHTFVALGAMGYFLVALHNHGARTGRSTLFEIVFATVFGLIACGFVVVLTANKSLLAFVTLSIFSDLYVEPGYELMNLLGLKGHLPGHGTDIRVALYIGVLVPTVLGIMAVAYATAAFHYVVCTRPLPGTAGWEAAYVACIATLKRNMTVLSLILVSSVLTARAYNFILPSLIAPGETAALAAYTALATTLSFSAGMLFMATLAASFAPGIVLLLQDLYGAKRRASADHFGAVLKRLEIAGPLGQLRSLLRIGLTVLAPALASPFMDALANIAIGG